MKNRFSSHSNVRMTLAATLCALSLSGCSMTTKTADATASTPASARTTIAKSGMTPSNLHADATASRTSAKQAQARPGVQTLSAEQAAALLGAAGSPSPIPAPENAFPPAPAPAQQTSIAGLATQPTGVRADSGTIFSANPPAPAVATGANGPVPADLPRRNFNAMTASVFSAPQPMRAAACGTDAQGNPLSC